MPSSTTSSAVLTAGGLSAPPAVGAVLHHLHTPEALMPRFDWFRDLQLRELELRALRHADPEPDPDDPTEGRPGRHPLARTERETAHRRGPFWLAGEES